MSQLDKTDNSVSEGEEGQAAPRPLFRYTYEGIHYPLFLPCPPGEHLRNVRKAQYRDGDVLVCSYPKSGTHWVLEIVSMLKRRRASPTANYTFLDILPTHLLEGIPSPRVFATHLRFNQLPVDFINHKAQTIYVLRNPKDVAVSLFTFSKGNRDLAFDGSWEYFLEKFLEGEVSYSSWFDHVTSWEEAKKNNAGHPILFVYYEDIKKNPEKEVRRIARFLGITSEDDFISAVVEKTRIEKMRSRQLRYYMVPPEYMDPNHSTNLFRKGKVGDWKQYFSKQQLQTFDQLYKERMGGSELSFKHQILH